MKRWGQTTSLFLIGFSVLIIASSFKIGVGSLQAPGPGFMGFLSSVVLLLLSLVILIEETVKSACKEGEEGVRWESLSKPFILTAALCGYAFFLDTLGFLLSSFILLFIMLLIDNPRKWITHLVVAFLMINTSYLILCKFLRVVLPSGIFRIRW